MVTTL
ncbi:hypothetical protein D030_3373A, partial [Vibrio parahaemolyticus AQ3810]